VLLRSGSYETPRVQQHPNCPHVALVRSSMQKCRILAAVLRRHVRPPRGGIYPHSSATARCGRQGSKPMGVMGESIAALHSH